VGVKERAILVEVLRNRFQAIVEEMGALILRAGHTVFVKETADFGAALVSPDGEVAAAPVSTGVALMVGMPCDAAIAICREMSPEAGDIFFTNDIHATGGMATHLPDLFCWKPIFHAGRIVCYAWTFMHCSDIGGRVPGSISPANTDIYQDGLRIPVVKLFRRGELNEDVLRLFMANCRIPDQNWGDIKALVAALNTAERRVHELCGRYGPDGVQDGIAEVLAYAEGQARAAFREIPDGDYVFWDYLEGEAGGGRPIRVKLAMRVRDGEIALDFSDTDPQTRESYSLPSHAKRGHWQMVFGLVNYLRSTRRDLAFNSGLVRPVSVVAPRGSLLNPEPGVSVGNRSATQVRLLDVVTGALAQARPDIVPAAGAGQASIMVVQLPDLETGGNKVSVVQPLMGGSGARPFRDGVDGIDYAWGFLRNVPAETIESEMPILIERYALRPDSMGAGRWRGGAGIELEVKVFPPNASVASRAMERYHFRPWGRAGGGPGATGYTRLNPDGPEPREIGKIDVLHLEPGDVLRVGTQGGGGHGDPLAREPERVAADVRAGFVSPGRAREDYGVVTDGASVDLAATEALRAERRRARADAAPPPFGFGAERLAYERVWPDALRTALVRALEPYPGRLRTFLCERVSRLVEARAAAGSPVASGEIAGLVTDTLAGLRWR
jgi:N-methylhydantoinase B